MLFPAFYEYLLVLQSFLKEVTDKDIPFTFANIFPGYSDNFAYKLDFIPNDQPIEDIRKKYRIDKAVREISNDDEDYSRKIREFVN